MHLLRADIVDGDDEDGLVLLEQALELIEVAGLVFGFAPHIFLFVKVGCLRTNLFDLSLGNVSSLKKLMLIVAKVGYEGGRGKKKMLMSLTKFRNVGAASG